MSLSQVSGVRVRTLPDWAARAGFTVWCAHEKVCPLGSREVLAIQFPSADGHNQFFLSFCQERDCLPVDRTWLLDLRAWALAWYELGGRC